MMDDASLHALAREVAATLQAPDKSHLRFNEIVACARAFYPTDLEGGVRELVEACDKIEPARYFSRDRSKPTMYVKGQPMWQSLRDNYGWMLPAEIS